MQAFVDRLPLPWKTEVRIYDYTQMTFENRTLLYNAQFFCRVSKDPCIYVYPALSKDYAAGRSRPCTNFGTVNYVPNHDDHLKKIIGSEYIKTLGAVDLETEPNLSHSDANQLTENILPESFTLIARCRRDLRKLIKRR